MIFEKLLVFSILVHLLAAFTYKEVKNWPNLDFPRDQLGPVAAVSVCEQTKEVYVAQRGTKLPPILVFDTQGKYLRGWGKGLVMKPHGLRTQPDGDNCRIWITDVQDNFQWGNCVKEFNSKGWLVNYLGTPGVKGTGLNEMDQPADVGFISNQIWVVDGDGGLNNRVVRFNSTSLLPDMHFGKKGTGPGEFYIPHSIVFDETHAFIADRMNNRTQIFDLDGKFVTQWTCMRPGTAYGLSYYAKRNWLIVSDATEDRILILSVDENDINKCTILYQFPVEQKSIPHELGFDMETEDLYVAEIAGKRVKKYRKIG